MESFTVRAYTKSELAQLYAPYVCPRAACKKLQMWIERNTELCDALQRSGLAPHSKTFTLQRCRCAFPLQHNPYKFKLGTSLTDN